MSNNAWIFDIDGVLTSLETRQVSTELLLTIIKINALGEPVAFVTGRSYSWVKDRILAPLQKYGRLDLSLIFCSCEKGGVQVAFRDNQAQVKVNQDLVVPKKIQKI